MEELTGYIEFVKSQQSFHERQATRFSDDLRRQSLHTDTANQFRSLAEYLIETKEKLRTRPATADIQKLGNGQYRIALTPEEVADLPEELMSELSVSDADKAEFNIVALIDEAGGIVTLDRILVALYRQSGQVTKRANLNARLYRMGQKGLVHSVPGKKGIYSTSALTDEDIKKFF